MRNKVQLSVISQPPKTSCTIFVTCDNDILVKGIDLKPIHTEVVNLF